MLQRDMGQEFISRISETIGSKIEMEELAKAKIASAILTKRYELEMSQTDFADYMNVSQAMVSKWESGENNFSISAIAEICEKLSMIFDISLSKPATFAAHVDNDIWDKGSADDESHLVHRPDTSWEKLLQAS